MSEPRNRQAPRRRPTRNTYTTKSGNTIKLNHSLTDRIRARRDERARRRAVQLSRMPQERWKRLLFRLKPSELYHYWFSREGAMMALKILGVGIVVCFILVVGLFAYFRKDLPNIKDISGDQLGGSITYYDRTGQTVLWQDYGAVKRIPVASNQISPYLKNATIAIEDKNFYHEGAFSVTGTLRAGLHDVFGGGGGLQGGSTITQQLVKLNEQWTLDRTITRKVKELILAVDLEREYSKDDILTGYLNMAPYGGEEYGAESAARDYFGVSANQLSLAQASMMAAIPQYPSAYSPYSSPVYNPAASTNYFDRDGLLARQHYILDQMVKQHMITQAQADQAKTVDVLSQVHQLQSKYQGIKAPYFVLAAKQQLENKYGASTVNRGGWKVITTMDSTLQNLAEQQVADDMHTVQKQGGDNAAFVAEDNKTGQIVALVGGADFSNPDYGNINYATDVNISPGSSFKPYDYTTFINNNNDVGAGSVLYDTQGALPGYPCTDKTSPKVTNPSDPDGANKCLWDYDLRYPGPVTLRYGLGGSRNVPAVKAMLASVPNDASKGKVDSINKVIATADSMMGNPDGYRCYQPHTDIFTATKADETQCYSSSAIGDGAYLHLADQVNGLATIAREGVEIPRTYILKITDSSGKVIDQFQQPAGTQVVRQDAAYIVDNMLSDPNASYLPGHCTATNCTPLSSFGYKFHRYNGWDFAVKTGTTNDAYDGLMASWSTQYTAVTWVGYHTRTKAMTGNMETMTEPIIRGWMQGAHDALSTKPVNWTQPSDIKVLPAYILRNKISSNGEIVPSPSTDLFPAWYVPKSSGGGSQTIDVVSGKLATSCTPDLAKKTEGGANDNIFSADIFVNSSGSSGSVTASDDVHNCSDAKPSISVTQGVCDEPGKCDFTVTVTQGTAALSGGSYTTAPAGTISLQVNGQTISTQSIPGGVSSPYTMTFSGVNVSDGQSVQVQVVDSLLYSGSASTTASGTSNGQSQPPTQNGGGQQH